MPRKIGKKGLKSRRIFKPRAGRTYYAFDKVSKTLYRFGDFPTRLEAKEKNSNLKVIGALEYRDLIAQDVKNQIKKLDLRHVVTEKVDPSGVFKSPQAVSALVEAIAAKVSSQLTGMLPHFTLPAQPTLSAVEVQVS